MDKLFDMDLKDYVGEGTRFSRSSVRGIIIREGRIAMVHSLLYDYYKFPGGGAEEGESMLDTLTREVKEETGLRVAADSVKEYGYVHRIQRGDPEDIFEQYNYYFLCQVEAESEAPSLDAYEEEEMFRLEFVMPGHAIAANRSGKHGPKDPVMIEREALVLEMLVKDGFIERDEDSPKAVEV